ncbi:MAG: nucleoside kinase [Clostridiales bacterium]|nr:nucleoside kinase [Clostridiales bacterium]
MTVKLEIGHWAEKGKQDVYVEEGLSLLEIAEKYASDRSFPIIGALYEHEVVDLYTAVHKQGTVLWLDLASTHGMRIYKQSLVMLLAQAVRELFPHWTLNVHHALGKHCYCELEGTTRPSSKTLELISEYMDHLIENDEPIVPHDYPVVEGIPMLDQAGYPRTARLLENAKKETIRIYTMGSQIFHSFYALAPSAGCLAVFSLEPYENGFLLRYPAENAPGHVAPLTEMPRVAGILRETRNWTKILNVSDVYDIHQMVAQGPEKVTDLVHISEALQEKFLANVADQIYEDRDRLRVVLIAGPSSSGKTTFCYRMAIQLRVLGLRPMILSTDNYFVNRWETPTNPDGSYDFESLRAINIDLFNQNLAGLIAGEEVVTPTFNFKEGVRIDDGRKLKLEPGHPLIIEGIHALNEALTPAVSRGMKFKIYISSMVQIDIDSYNRVATSDARLLRRIVRDYMYRGRTAESTLQLWPSVRQGEEQNIFPFQEDADSIFNTALLYETGVFKKYAEPLLQQIRSDVIEYADARRLLSILSYFPDIEDACVPLNSIIREFIGGGSIHEEST